MDITISIHGIDGIVAMMHKLPKEVIGKGRGGPLDKAVRAGANVILKQARSNLSAAIDAPGKTGVTKSTGFTLKNVFIKRKQPRADQGGANAARYIVTVRPKPHPSNTQIKRKSRKLSDAQLTRKRRKSKPIKPRLLAANDIAFIMEHGSSKQAATPWLMPAFTSRGGEAVQVIVSTLDKDLKRLIAKLETEAAAKR